MKKFFLLLLLCLLGIGSMQTAQAASEIYGVFSDDGKTFTIYYDENKTANGGVTPNDWVEYWYWEQRAKVETVVFHDDSIYYNDRGMGEAHPTSLYCWFSGFSNLTTIENIYDLNTDLVTHMAYLFEGCEKLTAIDFSRFNTAKVTNMQAMFKDCKSLKKLDLLSFNMSKVTDTRNMFKGCTELVTILSNSDWSSLSITQSTDMFTDCTKLVGGNGTVYDATKTDITYARPDGVNSKKGYLTEQIEVYVELVEATHTLTYYYNKNRASHSGVISVYNPDDHNPGKIYYWIRDADQATKAIIDESMKKADMTTMEYLFRDLEYITEIKGLQNLNTANVTNMYGMFSMCYSLTELDLSSFNTANVTNMVAMFEGCSALTELDLSSFNTANVTNMGDMFAGCSALTELDLRSFNTAKVEVMNEMFKNCGAVTTICCNDDWSDSWSLNKSNEMFAGCEALVGGNGTVYDAAKTDIEYARPDGVNGKKGYFSLKTCTVTFLDWDGDELHKEQVEEGHDAKGPDENPTREGYDFIGWSKPIINITADVTVIAQYKEVEAPDYTPQNLKAEVVTLEDKDQRITLSWDAVDGVPTYELQLFYNGLSLYLSNTYGKHEVSILLSELQNEVPELAPGTYQIDWQVRSTDALAQPMSEWVAGKQFEVIVPMPTGLENVGTHPSPDAAKLLRNGRVYILRNGEIFTTDGQRIR